MKRGFSLFLSLVMAFGIFFGVPFTKTSFPFKSFIAKAATSGDLTFSLNTDGTSYAVTACNSSAEGEIIIPALFEGLPVTQIEEECFYNCTEITAVTFPDGITSIGDSAFYNCKKLTEINLPNSVTSIGNSAFDNCVGITKVTLPNNITHINDRLFSSCSGLTEIVIPDSVESIGYWSFGYCTNLTSVVVGSNVTVINEGAFQNCTALEAITLPDNGISTFWTAFSGTAYYNDENNWENGILYIGNHLIEAKKTIYGEIVLRDNTKSIAGYSFKDCSRVTKVVTPDSVDFIGKSAFQNCTGLTEIVIPDSVKSIGDYAFHSCTGITKVTIGSGLTKCETNVFYECSDIEEIKVNSTSGLNALKNVLNEKLVKVVLGGNVDSIPDYTFSECTGLIEVILPDGVTDIGEYAFGYCSGITEIIIPDSVKSIGEAAFGSCTGLTEIVIPDSVTSIGTNVFYGCTGLTKVTIGSGLTQYGSQTFYQCNNIEEINVNSDAGLSALSGYINEKLVKVNLGDNVEIIPDSAFCECTGLTEITIPDSVKSIGDSAFCDCTNLNDIKLPDFPIQIGEEIIYGTAYYNDEKNIRDNGVYIGKHFIVSKNTAEDIVVEEGTLSIAKYAFESSNKHITLPKSLKVISDGAFEYAEYLKNIFYAGTEPQWNEIEIGENNENMDIAAIHFAATTHTPGGDWYISDDFSCEYASGYKYKKCTVCGEECEKVNITGHLVTDNVCEYCNEQQYTYTLEDGKAIITGCNYITEKMVIPGIIDGYTVVAIGDSAFVEEKKIIKITIPDSVTSIGYSAFAHCVRLTEITISDSVTSIGAKAFFDCSQLNKIIIPDNAINIGKDAFRETAYYYNDSNQVNGILYIGNHLIKMRNNYSAELRIREGTVSVAEQGLYSPDGTEVRPEVLFIPDSVKYINEDAINIYSLETINVSENNEYFSSMDGVLFNRSATELIRFPMSIKGETYTVPEGVTKIAPYAFKDVYYVSNVILSDKLTEIGEYAFSGSRIRKVTLPENLKTINAYTFNNCTSLKSVVIPEGMEFIGEYAFKYCSELEYVFYSGTQTKWSHLNVEDGNTYLTNAVIHYEASDHTESDWIIDKAPTYDTQGSRHKECVVCSYVTSTDTIPVLSGFIYKEKNVNSYELSTYLGIKTDVEIPATYKNCVVTSIGNGCFKDNKNITRVIIPIGVTEIGYLAFMNCTSLKYVSVPATVTEIGMQAFYGFDGIMLCQEGSTAHQYAIDNGIDYVIPTIEEASSKSTIDFEHQLIYTSVSGCTDITEIITTPATMISLPVAKSGGDYFGTGSTITVFDGVRFMGDYTIIVKADLNGDAVSDILDVVEAERVANGHKIATEEQIYAANGEPGDEFCIEDYQFVVNQVLEA